MREATDSKNKNFSNFVVGFFRVCVWQQLTLTLYLIPTLTYCECLRGRVTLEIHQNFGNQGFQYSYFIFVRTYKNIVQKLIFIS